MFPIVLQKYNKEVKNTQYTANAGELSGLNYELNSIMHYG